MHSPLALLFCAGLAVGSGPTRAQDPESLGLATGILTWLQIPSIQRNREYCGEIGRAPDGRLIHTAPIRGKAASCHPVRIRPPAVPLASYHTHAGFDPRTDGEVPSVLDVQGDVEDGMDGYVSTPGGRLWHIDGATGNVRQICGLGCLPADPKFFKGSWGTIRRAYTFDQLKARSGK